MTKRCVSQVIPSIKKKVSKAMDIKNSVLIVVNNIKTELFYFKKVRKIRKNNACISNKFTANLFSFRKLRKLKKVSSSMLINSQQI